MCVSGFELICCVGRLGYLVDFLGLLLHLVTLFGLFVSMEGLVALGICL